MTQLTKAENRARHVSVNIFFTVILSLFSLCSVFFISVFLSDVIAEAIRKSLALLAKVIIPSIFPFMILSDFLISTANFNSIKCASSAFERVFKINGSALAAFITGVLCGFPLGVRSAVKLYEDGKISRNECERLIGFCNNTGPAFLISGIGSGLYGNIKIGLCLYLSMLISAILVGIIFSAGQEKASKSDADVSHPSGFNITESIVRSGQGTLAICSYILAFSCISAITRHILGDGFLYLIIIPFLEIGSSTSIIASSSLISPIISVMLTGFTVGFSGICVHLQAKSFLSGTDIKMKKYFIMKLTQGVLCGIIAYICAILFNLC